MNEYRNKVPTGIGGQYRKVGCYYYVKLYIVKPEAAKLQQPTAATASQLRILEFIISIIAMVFGFFFYSS